MHEMFCASAAMPKRIVSIFETRTHTSMTLGNRKSIDPRNKQKCAQSWRNFEMWAKWPKKKEKETMCGKGKNNNGGR